MFGILEAVAVPHAGVYSTYDDLMQHLNGRMEKEGYKIVKARSHRSRMGGADVPGNDIVRCDLVCDRGGRPYKCMATKHKTSTKKTDCPWKAKAVNRKAVGGWVLTISCDQHNHEPGTPEPPTPTEMSENEDNEIDESEANGPRPDPDTTTAMQIAGVPEPLLRLSGDAFHQLKTDYRKMSQPDRLNVLSQLQLRIAAIYAVQNEDWQRQRRQEAQSKRHEQVESGRKQLSAQKQRARRQRRQGAQTPQSQQQQQQQEHGEISGHPAAQQLNQEAQVATHIQPLVQEPHFQLVQNSSTTPVPLPGMSMPPQFHQYPAQPRRIRGHRTSMTQQSASQPGQ